MSFFDAGVTGAALAESGFTARDRTLRLARFARSKDPKVALKAIALLDANILTSLKAGGHIHSTTQTQRAIGPHGQLIEETRTAHSLQRAVTAPIPTTSSARELPPLDLTSGHPSTSRSPSP